VAPEYGDKKKLVKKRAKKEKEGNKGRSGNPLKNQTKNAKTMKCLIQASSFCLLETRIGLGFGKERYNVVTSTQSQTFFKT